MTRPTVSQQLVDSYVNTIYRIDTAPQPIYLRIDEFSPPLALLLQETNRQSAAIISAYNPFSRQLFDAQNLQVHEQLRFYLRNHAYSFIEGRNIDPTGQWPIEKSFFVSSIDLNTAQALGCQFRQNAIVQIDSDAIPRLMLLR